METATRASEEEEEEEEVNEGRSNTLKEHGLPAEAAGGRPNLCSYPAATFL